MAIRQVNVSRLTITSTKPFDSLVALLDAAVGHPNMNEFSAAIAHAKTYAEMETIVQAAIGKSGFMEFARFNLGAVLAKRQGANAPKSLRFVIGNPLIMQAMVRLVPDAGSYAPVTLLVDERPDGVCLSYDQMVSLLTPYGNAEALEVARDLDAKVARLLAEVA